MTKEDRQHLSNTLIIIGLLVMLVMAFMPLIDLVKPWMRWAFAAGAAIVLVARFVGIYNGPSLRIKRLHRILIASALMYCVSALMMFYSPGHNDWIGFLLAGVIVQMYATWMIEREEKKELK